MQRFGVTGARAGRTVKRELKEVGKEIKVLTQDQKRLTAELIRTEKGTEAYKKLEKQVKAVGSALKEARGDASRLGDISGRGPRRTGGAAMRGASYARVTAQQMIGTLGAAGPEQTYGTIGGIAGGLGTALSNLPVVGAAAGVMGTMAQTGFNVMQRRASMLLSAQRARQAAGAYIMPGVSGSKDTSVTNVAKEAAWRGFGAEEAYGIMRSFGQAGGYRAGLGTLELSRMGFGPGAMAGAQLYAPGMGGGFSGSITSQERGASGKNLIRQMTAQTRLESRMMFGRGAERSITPSTVEERLTEMVGYLKTMAMDGVEVDPVAFMRETSGIFGLGQQAGKPGLFAGGRAFRFQTAMREGQRQEGGMLSFMAIKSGMDQGKDIISAMEDARLGRVPMGDVLGTMRGMGLEKQRWAHFAVGKQIGRPMAEVGAALSGDPSLIPKELGEMGRGGPLGMFRGAAPVSAAQKGLLGVKAKEMAAAEGSVGKMIIIADKMVGVQTEFANIAKGTWNALIDLTEGVKAMVESSDKIREFFTTGKFTMPEAAKPGVLSSAKL
jgi:hypothetical protein